MNLNKSLSQITSNKYYAANGSWSANHCTPESINCIVDQKTNEWFYLPSPINPLNWAMSTLGLAIYELLEVVN